MRSSSVDNVVEAEIYDVLHDRFFSDVFVKRQEARQINEKFQRRPVVVAGERGCGKSTLIARVEQDLNTRARRGNRAFTISKIDCNLLTGQARSDDVLELIFRSLFGELLVTTVSNSRLLQFWGVLLAGDAQNRALDGLRLTIRREVPDALTQHTHWTRAIHGNEVWAKQLEDAFQDLPVSVRLRELATAMPELLAGGALIVDNIDHLGDHVQVELLEELVKTNTASGQQLVPLVGIRTENYRRVKARLVGAQIVDAQVLTDSTVIVNHRHDQVVRDYVRQRLGILTEENVPSLYERLDSADGRAAARALGFQTGRQMFEELMNIAKALSGDVSSGRRSDRLPRRVLHELNDWSNYSLRDVGLAIANLAYQLLPVIQSRALTQFRTRSWDVRFREMRNLLIRQHVLYDKTLTVRHPPHAAALLFAQPKQPGMALDFLDYHLLTMIRSTGMGRTAPLTLKDVIDQLSPFGLRPDVVKERLAALAVSRDTDDMGLVRLLEDHEPDRAEIEMLSAGRFTSLYLLRTYEYSFWNAAALHDGTFERILERVAFTCRGAIERPSTSILQRHDGLPTVGTWAWQREGASTDVCPVPYTVWSNSIFRALVAQEYLRDVVRPRYWQMLAELDDHQTRSYRRLFGKPDLPYKILAYWKKYVDELANDRSMDADDSAMVRALARQRETLATAGRSNRRA